MWRRTLQLLILPLRIIAEIFVAIFDMVISRYLLAASLISVLWVPCYLIFDASRGWFLWPSLVLGMAFCGLWDGCQIFTIRDYVAKTGLIQSWSDIK
jgi:hypothetical protein